MAVLPPSQYCHHVRTRDPKAYRRVFVPIQVLSGLEAGGDAPLQAIASSAQRFAYRHLSQTAKALYVRRAVVKYNHLFGGWLERFVAQQLDASRLSIDHILDALRREVGAAAAPTSAA